MTKLSVAYLVDDGCLPSLVYDLIEKSKSAEHYSIDYLIVQTSSEDKSLLSRTYRLFKKHGLLTLVSTSLLGAILAVESRIFVRSSKLKTAFDLHDSEIFQGRTINVRPLESTTGRAYRYREEDLEVIKSLDVDVLLNGQSGNLCGGILEICEFGVISHHYGNDDIDTGGPPGFWEVFNQEPSTRLVVQRLRDELNGRDVLMAGSIPTKPTYAQNLAQLCKRSTIFMHRFLEDLGRTRILPEPPATSNYACRPYTTPPLHVIAMYQLKTFIIIAGKLFSRSSAFDRPTISGKYDRWGVAYQFTEDWQRPVLSQSSIIANPPHRFLADPFVYRRGDLDVCFVEDYDFRTNRARISVFKVDGNKCEELGSALDEPFHLSYPFIFAVDNELYMCPETAEIREIRLYKCTEFPLGWSFHKTLLKNVAAVDSDIFFFKDRWWLLTNIDSSEIGESCSELHVFYSDVFDSDAWTPHPQNPVIFDSERARNGGFFRDGDRLMRVFQRQGFDQYGESMAIAQIEDLGTETYREKIVNTIEPDFIPKIIGTHSFTYHNGLLAVDFLRVERIKGASR